MRILDLRNTKIEIINTSQFKYSVIDVFFFVDDKQVGKLQFREYLKEKVLEIELISIDEIYRNLGIATTLYKEFGEIYSEKYMGWKVERWFANPIAEYAFRKAVGLGWVPQEALNENSIIRTYRTEDIEKAVDLRNKLPENVRGPAVWAMKKEAEKVDARKIRFSELVFERDESEENYIKRLYSFNVFLTGISVGKFKFFELRNFPMYELSGEYSENDIIEQGLYISEVEVKERVRNIGIGQLMYKKFGEIYNSKYNGWPVARYFENPVAEYAFRKAVSLGWINGSSLTEQYIQRDYSQYKDENFENANRVVKDLRNKLPESVRNTNIWAKLADKIDARDVQVVINENSNIHSVTIFSLDGTKLGYFDYRVYDQDEQDKYIFIMNVMVYPMNQNLGIGQILYKEFGKIYTEKYNEFELRRYFLNPVAEYAYRKSVALGYIPESTLVEEKMKRNYDESHEETIRDLRKKLPDKVKGTENWAKLASIIFKKHVNLN